MDWRKKYKHKIVSAAEAVGHIKSGDRVAQGNFVSEPPALVAALAARAPEVENVEYCSPLSLGPHPFLAPEMRGHVNFNSLFVGSRSRGPLAEGKIDFTPIFFGEWPRVFAQDGPRPVDVALICLTPPDKNGICSFGNAADYNEPLAQNARTVIAQINKNMPRTFGNGISLDEVDWIVERDDPVYSITPAVPGDTDQAIGDIVATLIPDGSTIQVGFGRFPDAVVNSMRKKKDLGIHSEMISNGVMSLAQDGVITGQRKSIHRGKIVAAMAAGDQGFYDWLNNNPMVELLPVNYVNDPFVIAKNFRQVSINSAIEVDLFGQVCSESLGFAQFSGIGGQLDCIRGARRAKDGKAIIALPSTASKGEKSRIVFSLSRGSIVTVTRHDVDYVVTEYGIAQLWGRSIRERARALIAVAHPKFRDELQEQARSINLIW